MPAKGVRVLGSAVLAAAFVASLSSASGAAEGVAAVSGAIPVDAMPPVMRDAYLLSIREELAARGYGPEAGREGLTAAIRAYQHHVGLPEDGVATKELLDHIAFVRPRMKIAPNKPNNSAIAHPSASRPAPPALPGTERRQYEAPVPVHPPPGMDDTVTSEPLPSPPDTKPRERDLSPRIAPPSSSRDLPPGRGGFVTRVQRELKRRGFYDGPIDGQVSPSLSRAIARFQRFNGLAVTGVIDGRFLNALQSARARPGRRAPRPKALGSGKTAQGPGTTLMR